jgi:methylated-DNA-[protein]-cysteine S-methyltransferase
MPACQFVQTLVPTPLGVLTLVSDPDGLVGILWPGARPESIGRPGLLACTGQGPHLDAARLALENYFSNRPFEMPSLRVAGTDFQKSVWEALKKVPRGETRTYAQIAAMIGKPSAVRAVATAIGKNPFPVLVPCHRVIGTDGGLHGFAGGLPAKEWLLGWEKTPLVSPA